VPARSKTCVCGSWLAGVAGSNPPGHGIPSVARVVFCQLMVYVTGRLFVQGSPTECGVSECDRKTSKIRKPWPTRECRTMKNNYMKITVQTRSGDEIFFIQEARISNLGRGNCYPEVFRGFSVSRKYWDNKII